MDARTALEIANQFDMTEVLGRYQEETRLPSDVIAEHALELKKFLTLCAVNPGNYGMRGPIDELWHTFIIFTEKYHQFCQQLCGKYIHHFPVPHKDAAHFQPDAVDAYKSFLEDYAEAFGVEPPLHIWPRPLPGSNDSPSCNKCGSACSHKCYA